MQINNLLKYSDNYTKEVGSLWKYSKGERNDDLSGSISFKCSKKALTNVNIKAVKIPVL